MPHAGASHLVEAAAVKVTRGGDPRYFLQDTHARAHSGQETFGEEQERRKKLCEQVDAGAMQVQENTTPDSST